MGLFGNKKPKLPSYAGVGLEALLQDPEWAYAISQAGITPGSCEVVLRLSGVTVATGFPSREIINAAPAILFCQGTTLAMAFAGEREVRVTRRDAAKAELQTQRSGSFQILFGPVNNLDGFMFMSDNLELGSPEGEQFGQLMSGFLRGQLQPQRFVGTPQDLVASAPQGPSHAGPAPEFDNPDDALRWDALQSTQVVLSEVMAQYEACLGEADKVERAWGVANAEYVDGVRQHPISKEHFRKLAVEMDGELEALLASLREQTKLAATHWQDLVFLFPGDENPVIRMGEWAVSIGVGHDLVSSVASQGVLIHTDFGLTRESFWIENERLNSVLSQHSQ